MNLLNKFKFINDIIHVYLEIKIKYIIDISKSRILL